MRLPLRRHPRRAATLVEAAIIMLVFIVLIVGLIDIGVGVFRYNALSQAARHAARRAIVHGSKAIASYDGGPWGPTAVGPVAASATTAPVLAEIRPHLATCDLTQTMVTVEWLNGGNDVEQRVRVTVTTPYRPILLSVLGNQTVTLRAVSTMPIAH